MSGRFKEAKRRGNLAEEAERAASDLCFCAPGSGLVGEIAAALIDAFFDGAEFANEEATAEATKRLAR